MITCMFGPFGSKCICVIGPLPGQGVQLLSINASSNPGAKQVGL